MSFHRPIALIFQQIYLDRSAAFPDLLSIWTLLSPPLLLKVRHIPLFVFWNVNSSACSPAEKISLLITSPIQPSSHSCDLGPFQAVPRRADQPNQTWSSCTALWIPWCFRRNCNYTLIYQYKKQLALRVRWGYFSIIIIHLYFKNLNSIPTISLIDSLLWQVAAKF